MEKPKSLHNSLYGIWCCISVAVYPVLFLYFSNIEEVLIADVVVPLITAAIVNSVLCVATWSLTREWEKAAFLASVTFIIATNYFLIENMCAERLPMLKYWHLMPITIVVLLHLLYFINKKVPQEVFRLATQIMALVFSALTVLNLATAVPRIVREVAIVPETAPSDTIKAPADPNLHPNIYYLLFDEYSNFSVLEEFYQYPNAELKEFLEENHFNISLDSHNNSVSTKVITTNNLNLDYVTSDPYNCSELRENPALFKLLDQYGYSIKFSSKEVPVGWEGADIQTASSTTVDGLDFQDLLIQRTILYPFLSQDDSNVYIRKFYDEFKLLDDSIRLKNNNSFVYMHFLSPHLPFIFDENGNYVGMENRNNTTDGKYYLGQLIYTTKYMKKSVQKILDEDPNCIIILQSDHSNRYIGSPIGQGSQANMESATNIFNAVYFLGEDMPEIQGQSAVNTLRSVLNRALGTNFEMVEAPENE